MCKTTEEPWGDVMRDRKPGNPHGGGKSRGTESPLKLSEEARAWRQERKQTCAVVSY